MIITANSRNQPSDRGETPGGKDHNAHGLIRVRRPTDGEWIWVQPWQSPDLPGAIRFGFSPGTLGTALAAEADGLGHVEFRDGVPCWVAGPARFQSSEAA